MMKPSVSYPFSLPFHDLNIIVFCEKRKFYHQDALRAFSDIRLSV